MKEPLDLASSALPAWSDAALHNGFLGRYGYTRAQRIELNFSHSVDGERASVDANWKRLRDTLTGHNLVAQLNQVHSKIVHLLGDSYDGTRLDGDGMVTTTPGLILSVRSADCVPVLLVDRRRMVAGALHAGWRGVIADIAGEGIAAMTSVGAHPQDIEVALGPGIGECCFEVDRQLADRFDHEVEGAGPHVRDGRPGKAHLNLKGILTNQMVRCGIAPSSIKQVGPCTVCARDRYFSRRGDGEVKGLQVSFVGFRLPHRAGDAGPNKSFEEEGK